MKKIAIITARGGSKRIPGKNIKDFCGKPILAYSIEAAIKSDIFDTVMVSTDDAKIADIAKKYGAQVPFLRSDKTSNDYASTPDVVQEVLAEYEKLGETFDITCCIYPTAPFITPAKLKKAVELLITNDADSVVPVVRFSFPPQRSFIIEDGCLKFKWPEHMLSRSQDLEPFYHDSGQFYCMKTDRFLQEKKLFMDKTIPMEMPNTQVQDIDDEEDWKIAEMKYKIYRENGDMTDDF